MGLIKRVFGRFSQDESERRSASIREWAASVEGATAVADVQARTVAKIAGVVEAIKVLPREGSPSIEAVIADGSGRVTAVWLGRRTLPGLALGTRMVIEGRLGGESGGLQMMNPAYEFSATQA